MLFPPDLVLTPLSRRPTRLEESTLRAILERPVPALRTAGGPPQASVVILTRDNLPFMRLCLESVLGGTEQAIELIVLDNGSSDGTAAYLDALAERNPAVQVLTGSADVSFAAGCNRGIAEARSQTLVLLNDDTAVCRGWLDGMLAHLDRPGVGMVGPVTNRTGNEAQLETDYRTWSELADFAADRASRYAGQAFELEMLTMFCVALRRELFDTVGPLDESFATGMLEDDDYSRRVRAAGHRLLCAEDVFVHHFGETSFGRLVPTGEYARVLRANQQRYAEKWGEPWQPYRRRPSERYRELTERLRALVSETVPADATVLVVSRGDDELLQLEGRRAWHFPGDERGEYAGYHPADSSEAIEVLEAQRAAGAGYIVFPDAGAWWLEHYDGLRRHLDDRYLRRLSDPGTCVIFDLTKPER
jgi:GT2 family glycosyltransferase